MKNNYALFGIGFVILMVLVAGLTIIIGNKSGVSPKPAASTIADLNLEGPALQRNAEDTTRKNDASRLLASVSEFQANNNGKLPSAWKDGKLVGARGDTEALVELDYYKAVVVRQGANEVLSEAELGLTTGAECGSGGVAVAASGRSTVAQFHVSSGPECIEL